jgi:hypothetical protein
MEIARKNSKRLGSDHYSIILDIWDEVRAAILWWAKWSEFSIAISLVFS